MLSPPSVYLNSNYRPDIHRRGQREHQTREKYRRSSPFKVSAFLVIEIRKTQFGKEKHRQNKVDYGEHHVVHNLFYLPRRRFPCVLKSPRDVSRSLCENTKGHCGHSYNREDKRGNNF